VFGVLGEDHHEWIAHRMRERGVETAGLLIDPAEPTAFTVAVTTPQDRTFFSYLGANRGFAVALSRVACGRLLHARHVHLACAPSWDTAGELFDAIHANGCTISLDTGWHEEWLADPRALATLPKVDIFFPNEGEAARMTGASGPEAVLRRFADAGVQCVALKLGERGAALLCDGAISFGGGVEVTTCDTTGAGDCFDAGFLHAWLNSEPPDACLRLANLCGALSCEAYGGIAGFPTRERLSEFLCKR
jgi:sugar/nucleoside kinase (ribokinase family)